MITSSYSPNFYVALELELRRILCSVHSIRSTPSPKQSIVSNQDKASPIKILMFSFWLSGFKVGEGTQIIIIVMVQ